MCRLYGIVFVLFRTRLIFPRINGPNIKFAEKSRRKSVQGSIHYNYSSSALLKAGHGIGMSNETVTLALTWCYCLFCTNTGKAIVVEDITWPLGDTKFLFECWKYLFLNVRKFLFSKCPVGSTVSYINTNEIPSHFTWTFFSCKRRGLLCSTSNGDLCFHGKADLVTQLLHNIRATSQIQPTLS